MQLDPNDSRAHGWYAQYLAAQGRSSEALAEARKSLELRPLSRRGQLYARTMCASSVLAGKWGR
ncbi:MAG: hypothetical protein ACYCOR_05880 [Acidobacteriaceae bacterium]